MTYEEFVKQTLGAEAKGQAQVSKSAPKKSAEEIIAEFLPMIEAERRRMQHG